MSTLHSKIDYIGQLAQAYTATNSQQSYVVEETNPSSYAAITRSGGLDPATLGGAAPFAVEGDVPVTNRFFELKINNSLTKPAALQIGSFSLSTNGVLTFVAGAPLAPLDRPQIVSNGRAGNQQSISFTTQSGGTYRLRYTSTINPNIAIWTVLPITVPGDGSTKTLTDTSGDPVRFYAVEAFR
jgi:hypothetical protein